MNYEEQNRITLKNVQYLASQSQETHCYTADLYFDGKKVGTTGNSGHGGGDDYSPLFSISKDGDKINRTPINRAGYDAMMKYIAGFDAITFSPGGGNESHSYQPDLEHVCGELMNEWLTIKELKKHTSKRVVYTLKGKSGIYQTKGVDARTREHWIKEISKRPDTDQVLNSMPIAEAVALFRERT